ncbi:MAG TPA: DUF1127 domain-containing protein [Methylomirabilota bacterium]|nr:DUF1127 domain-containing protein [Methylomirabilota bacterium]
MDTILRIARPAGGAARGFEAGASRLRGVLRALVTWSARSRQRRALAGLDDAMLKDIGLSRADIAFEAAKPFWRE